ncbi:C40 family peptidase [Paenibacillus sp. SAF-054]|uniref:C40 family peptidase n=1 Tax=unclassified Paenibacillus TaxID=185978 RepID=UPI003F7D449D
MNIRKSLLLCLLLSATVSTAAIMPAGSKTEAAAAPKITVSQTGIIQASVKLRDKPSMSSQVVAYLQNGEQVSILEKSSAYFYKVKTSSGKVGYTSTSAQYIVVKAGNGAKPAAKPANEAAASHSNTSSNAQSNTASRSDSNAGSTAPVLPSSSSPGNGIEQVIQTGMKYLGTPYEYGSNRNQTKTFDCSAFTRQIFKEAAGVSLPMDSRQQGTWVKDNSETVYEIDQLKRGDLVFFMDYQGTGAASYTGINPDQERITHVALYLGDGKLLHTYSVKAGGVVVTDFSSFWKLRFLYGGSVIQ